ncbi:hypothetical protein CEXT_659921 [Caerostris extrusa]|uniref:Uncharacterized protein n=1 Tax=Caerostris extrusa TaxID=172846 RepID=A0AAV4XTK6_CAEEX|nr:hypothetical protein CEXT_659921 [Caerostris extrusa]
MNVDSKVTWKQGALLDSLVGGPFDERSTRSLSGIETFKIMAALSVGRGQMSAFCFENIERRWDLYQEDEVNYIIMVCKNSVDEHGTRANAVTYAIVVEDEDDDVVPKCLSL